MKNIYLLLFAFLSLNLFSQDCGSRYQTEIYPTVSVSTVDFGAAENMAGNNQTLQMDIYQADGDTATDRPVVLFCFGGSFVGGDRTSGELVSFATSLAKRGYVCASIDYRLAASALDLLQEEKMVKVVFGAVQDGKAAIRYFRKNADEGNSLGIDPDQIFIGGTSAGGILAINLAYMDDTDKLPTTWQSWANEIGGIEGNSGNPDYCSYVSGVFSFAGAVGDTSYIEANDVPFYSCHATGDETVLYGYGSPLNGLAPVSLYGSGNLETRLTNLGIYNSVDTYGGTDHPPLGGTNMATTTDNLGTFLYNLLDCNTANLKHDFQQDCDDFNVEPIDSTNVAINNIQIENDWIVYPNPSEDFVIIKGENKLQEILLFDVLGREIISMNTLNRNEIKVNIEALEKGHYQLKVLSNNVWSTEKLLIK